MPEAHSPLFPLAEIQVGERAVVCEFRASQAVQKRLASLGFTPGVEVEMTQNYGIGPLIVTVRGTHVALGRGEAAKIMVCRSEGL